MLKSFLSSSSIRCAQNIALQRRFISKTVLIKGLPHDLNPKDLETKALEYGPVKMVRFIVQADKYRSCTGIIAYHELNSALAVMDELQHTVLFGRRIEVSFNRFTTVNNNAIHNNGKKQSASEDNAEN